MKIIMLGDSTSSAFNDTTYFFPRYGYGTKLEDYFRLKVLNLALSGRSSKSFLTEKSYSDYLNNVNAGDYVFIGFGHNDEKEDDIARFTNASLDIDDPKSFKYCLYENYIKPALNAKAVPILLTPIVRLDLEEKYEGNTIHITKNGDYRLATIELAKKLNLLCIDLTTKSLNLNKALGLHDSMLLHAITKGYMENDELMPDFKSVDKTHLNHYGAKVIAYMVALEVSKSKHSLRKHLKELVPPDISTDLFINPEYEVYEYQAPDLANYKPTANFKIEASGLYGTAFGDTNVIPNEESGYIAKEENNKFIVGESTGNAGKLCATMEGFSYLFKQVSIKKNSIIKAHAKVLKTSDVRQAGFGLMIRDDAYINQAVTKFDATSNHICAGFICMERSMEAIFSREVSTELKYYSNTIPGFYNLDDECDLFIERLGQSITARVIYKGITYEKTFLDFDISCVDGDYYYIGMYATKGTVVEFSEVSALETTDAKEA